MSRRTEKVARLIQVNLGELINYHLSDPRVDRMVNVTRVDVSPDLKQAWAFVTIVDDSDAVVRKVMRGLEQAAGKLRRLLGDRLDTRVLPRLDIRLDEGAMTARRTLDAINRAMADTPPLPEDDDADDSSQQENASE